MKQHKLGATNVRIPVIGQGTWQMELDDRKAVIAALRRGIELGMTHIDTAEMYGSGQVERIVGEALLSMGAPTRDRVFLASKVLPQNATRKGAVEACERSLKRLRTDVLDLYLLHWPSEHPLRGTIEAFEALVERGLVRHWGVSNFDADALDEVVEIAGAERCACNQVLYHLKERAVEHRVLPKCEELGMTLVAYSPFGQADFPSLESKGGRVLAEIGARHRATSRQVALAFLSRRASLAAIPKSSQAGRVEENAKAGDLELSEADVTEIEKSFPLGPMRALRTA